jgi:hypothetical protein
MAMGAPSTNARSLVYSLDLTWGIWKGLSLRGTFSVLQLMAEEVEPSNGGGTDTVKSSAVGFGDTPVILQYLFQSGSEFPSPWTFGLGAGAYLPSGTGIKEDFPSNSTFVSGTTDPVISLSGSYNTTPEFGIYAHGLSRVVVAESNDGFRAGSSFMYGVGFRLRYFGSLGLSLGLNALHKLEDREPEQDGTGAVMNMGIEEGSGGSWIFLAPALSYLFIKGPLSGFSIQLSCQLPVYQFLNGAQVAEDFNVTLGLGYGFQIYG